MPFYLTSFWGKEYFGKLNQYSGAGAGAGAGCFWLLGAGAAWEKNQEPEPLEKKSGAGARAAKKFAGSPALINSKYYKIYMYIRTMYINVFNKHNQK